MADYAHEQTDKILSQIEKKVQNEYLQAYIETKKKLDDYLRRLGIKAKIKQKKLANGEITQDEYRKWLMNQIMIEQRWNEMCATLAKDYVNSNKIAQSIVKGYMPEVYALNHNYGTFQVESQSLVDTSYTLYDRQTVERLIRLNPQLLPDPKAGSKTAKRIAENKDFRWNRQKITSAVTQGVLQGDSIPNIANRLESVATMNHKDAIKYARTMATGAENAGRLDSYRRAERMGIKTKKVWIASLDGRTRGWHRELDGVSVPNEEYFVNEYGEILYPGDPGAEPANVYNCRCTMICEIEGYETDMSMRTLDPKLGNMTYQEWKANKDGGHSNPIDLPEKKAEKIRRQYIKEDYQ